jgi:hypothetical protein
LLGASTLIASESQGFYGTVLLVGTGTVVDDLAAELVGAELELERTPREQAVALIQLVAPDLLVLAADCAIDGGLGVLAELAAAGVTKDIRVLVVCESGVKASSSQSTFRHVVRLPPQRAAKERAARIKAVLARLTQTGAQQEPLQRIVDSVCAAQTKQAVPAAQSPSPRGAFGARPQATAAIAGPAKTPAKTMQFGSTVGKAVSDGKQPASTASNDASAAKKPSRVEPSRDDAPLTATKATKQASDTLPLSVFANIAQSAETKPGAEATRTPVQAADASRQTTPANVAQPLASAQPKTATAQPLASAQPKTATAQLRAEQQQPRQALLNTPAKTQGQPSPFGSTQAKATMMQWSTAGQSAEASKPQSTLKLNMASPPADQPVALGPWPVVAQSHAASQPQSASQAAEAAEEDEDVATRPPPAAATQAGPASVSVAVDVAQDDFDIPPPQAAAVRQSPVSESPGLDVAIEDFDTRPPPAAAPQAKPTNAGLAVDVAQDDFDTRPPPSPTAKQSPPRLNPAPNVAFEDFDARPTPAPTKQAKLPSTDAAVEAAIEDFAVMPPLAAVHQPNAAGMSRAAAKSEDFDVVHSDTTPPRAAAGFKRWFGGGTKAARSIVAAPAAKLPRLGTAHRLAPRPLMLVAIVLAAIGTGSAWALLQQQGAGAAGQALLLTAADNHAPGSNKGADPSGPPNGAADVAVRPAARTSQAVAPSAEMVADVAANDESSAAQSADSRGLTQAQALVEDGLKLFKDGRLGLAEAAYLKALKLEPRNPRAMAGLVRVHIQRGDGVEAVRWAVTLCATQPNRGQNHTLLGDAWALRDNEPAAQSAWRLGARLGDAVARKRLQQ